MPPLSWPLISSCIWLALLHLRPRVNAADKRQACAGLLASAMMLLFLLQDGEFTGWGESTGLSRASLRSVTAFGGAMGRSTALQCTDQH